MKFLFTCFVLFSQVIVFAQVGCDSLKLTLKKKSYQRSLINAERQPLKASVLESEYTKLRDRAMREVKKCMIQSKPLDTSLEALQLNYIYGKLLLEMGKLKEAHEAFKFCLAHPLCKTEKIRKEDPKPYSHYINTYISSYILPHTQQKHEGSSGKVVYIEFASKGGSFMKSIFDEVDGEIFDDSPLDADEMESIASKTVYATDEINADLAFNLSGSKKYLLSNGFLVMQQDLASNGGINIVNPTIVESEDVPLSTIEIYANLLSEYREKFISLYFDSLNTKGRLMPVYLFEGEATSASLTEYLNLCDKMHHRAHRGVAYYQPLDNSIVVWTASGRGTVIHELVHGLVANDFVAAPLWLNEGLASLYEEIGEDGQPADNHRLVLVQQFLLKYQKCLLWTELLSVEAKQETNQMEMNVLLAFSRYFCKFVLDNFGQENLSTLYKTMREQDSLTPESQEEIIRSVLKASTEQIQNDWQNYLLKQYGSPDWRFLTENYAADLNTLDISSFQSLSIADRQDELQLLQLNVSVPQNGIIGLPQKKDKKKNEMPMQIAH